MSTTQSTRHQLTEAGAVKGAIVYKGNGKAPMRIIGVCAWQTETLVSVVKASTADRPGLRSTWQPASLYTVESE